MFWASNVKPDEPSVQRFATDLHVSAAVLDVESLPKNSKKGVQLWFENEIGMHLVCNLSHQTPQFGLDIGFSKSECVTFYTKGGPGTVYLHGYYVPDECEENDEKSYVSEQELIKTENSKNDDQSSRALISKQKKDPSLDTDFDDDDESQETVQTMRGTLKRKNKTNDNTRSTKVQKRECGELTLDHSSIHDTLPFHGYNPYFGSPSHWSPSAAFGAVHPDVYKYQQMIANSAYNPKFSRKFNPSQNAMNKKR